MSTMYERIEQLCKDNLITITEMCRELKIGRSSLSELGRGRSKKLNATSTVKIANYFSVSPEYLADGIPESVQKHFIPEPQREEIKSSARATVNDLSKDLRERIEAQITVYECLFSRSYQSQGYDSRHVCFEDYVAMMLNQNRQEQLIPSDVFSALVSVYGQKEGIEEGKSYAIISNVQVVSKPTFALSESEKQHIKKYRSLDHYGRKAVDSLMDIELERCSVVVELPRLITLPMADLPASAGTGQWLDENTHFEDIDVIDTPQARTANIIIKVSGDSMEPLYHDGDALLVQRKAEVEQGEIGVFIIDGCGYIKKLGHNELISVNPEYDNIVLTSDNAAVCFGKVVGLAQFPK